MILADEPTAALDSVSGRNVMEMMRDLARKHGRGVVVVTHDSRVTEFADRIVHMEDGRIVEEAASGRKRPTEVVSMGLPLAAGAEQALRIC